MSALRMHSVSLPKNEKEVKGDRNGGYAVCRMAWAVLALADEMGLLAFGTCAGPHHLPTHDLHHFSAVWGESRKHKAKGKQISENNQLRVEIR